MSQPRLQTGMPLWQTKWWMVPLWRGCGLLTSTLAAVMPVKHPASLTGIERRVEKAGPHWLTPPPGWLRWTWIGLDLRDSCCWSSFAQPHRVWWRGFCSFLIHHRVGEMLTGLLRWLKMWRGCLTQDSGFRVGGDGGGWQQQFLSKKSKLRIFDAF